MTGTIAMRILHTADWHMNDSLGRVDRSADICRVLEQIAGYLEEYHVDVMLVAGDLFSDRSRPEQLRADVAEIKRLFLPFLQRGGTIVAISGNHDSEIFFQTLRDALALVSPGRQSASDGHATGRLYVAPNPRLLRLADPAGDSVQFALMPYPTARCYLRGENVRYRSIEEKHRLIQQAFVVDLAELKARLDTRLPSVLVSHVHVRGARVHPLYRLSEAEDVVFEPGDIPAHWAYVAYGHIHQPQPAVAGATHIRYAGSIERLDAGECEDTKSVVLCEIGRSGIAEDVTLLPLSSTPIYRVEITDPDTQLPHLADRYPDAARALVHYTLHWHPAKHSRDELCDVVHGAFPRWYARDFREVGRDDMHGSDYTTERMFDVMGTVREYLRMALRASHPHRDNILALAENLLAEEGWR